MTLKNCRAGETAAVEAIATTPAMKRRLHILGLTEGTDVTVMRKKRCGTMIIKVRGVRYALGADAAGLIFVTERTDRKNAG